jgi:glyoxylate utilization-related uncharacterized protein
MTRRDKLDVERLAETASSGFCKRVVELEPESLLLYEADAWRDAIVFVTAGEIELECTSGERHRFRRGDILCLEPFPIRAVRNSSRAPARLLAVRRRARESTG